MDAKKGRKRKGKSNSFDLNQLTKGQKKHLKEYGELHPVDIEEDNEAKATMKRPKKIERIVDESMKTAKNKGKDNTKESEKEKRTQTMKDNEMSDDENEEISAYQKLVSSFVNEEVLHKKKMSKKLAKKLNKNTTNSAAEKSTEDSHRENDLELKKDEEQQFDDFNEVNDSDSEDDSAVLPGRTQPDPFSRHFEVDLEEDVIEKLEHSSSEKPIKTTVTNGTLVHYPSLPELQSNDCSTLDPQASLERLWVKPKLCQNWNNLSHENRATGEAFTKLQQELFPILNSYQDMFYCHRNFSNGEEIRKMYCLHALNHVLKTRSRILKNNAKIVQAQKESKELSGELRDHGLTRPKVLIVVPFRDSALKIVEILIKLLMGPGEGQVMNKKRFTEKFSETETDSGSQQNKPDDFKKMFAGNSDDFFRVGVVIMRKTIKLYTEFYSSDIIIASPVGLRSIIGAEGENRRDYDFLSSIEVLIMDQMDVFLMQNWEHVQHVFDHLHLQPKDSHEVDFSRVRMWNLNGWSKYYRQTILFSSFVSPEMNFIFNKKCFNYSGRTKILPASQVGSVCQVVVQIPQVYHKVLAPSHKEIAEKRFEFFVNKIFPELKGAGGLMSHTAIFIPSYFDFVRLRNFLKKEEIDFLQLSEYTSRANISRSRIAFLQGATSLLLFTERFYFYYRYRIRGIKNIVFYELPRYAHFYPEIVNYMDTSLEGAEISASNCTVLYSKFGVHRLSAIVGGTRCTQMTASEQTVHMFVTGE